ncbi:MAG: DUF2220 family protein [Tissierellia bacterium]|nr:DUF2220 family protein [Tissierellia bacterium]MDD3939243.1 DUF2220 family protein [Patescibacteria group bacterium]MDD4677729.1 DUF2220 family protein [Tissierellia bacterium]
MICKYEKEIINKLLDKYEKSKSFIGDNKVNQNFTVKIPALFPKYKDQSNFEVFKNINDAVDILVRKELVFAKQSASHLYNNVIFNLEKLKEAYDYAGRISKKQKNDEVIKLLQKYESKNVILKRYCFEQYERINNNKSIEYFNDDLKELENVLIACCKALNVSTETYLRDFSIQVFKDSKLFEKISSKVINLLFQYGDFPEKETVLGNLNIVKNPSYINVKGNAVISLAGQELDLSKIKGDIAISSVSLCDIDNINVIGDSVITIENLTSFHTFNEPNMFTIYLGGYHNKIRREFIKKMYEKNPNISYLHFGDIDAGGFYILEHLRRETGVDFKPYKMDIETIKSYKGYTKKLTENDRIRLNRLLDSKYSNVIEFMLENNCKLEQESTNL